MRPPQAKAQRSITANHAQRAGSGGAVSRPFSDVRLWRPRRSWGAEVIGAEGLLLLVALKF